MVITLNQTQSSKAAAENRSANQYPVASFPPAFRIRFPVSFFFSLSTPVSLFQVFFFLHEIRIRLLLGSVTSSSPPDILPCPASLSVLPSSVWKTCGRVFG